MIAVSDELELATVVEKVQKALEERPPAGTRLHIVRDGIRKDEHDWYTIPVYPDDHDWSREAQLALSETEEHVAEAYGLDIMFVPDFRDS